MNNCIWLITDHKLDIEDKFVQLKPTDINAIIPITTWLIVLNNLAVSDLEVSCCGDLTSKDFQLPTFKINPEFQVAQTEESVTVHILQLLTVHLLIVKLIIFWTGLDIPEIVEVM